MQIADTQFVEPVVVATIQRNGQSYQLRTDHVLVGAVVGEKRRRALIQQRNEAAYG